MPDSHSKGLHLPLRRRKCCIKLRGHQTTKHINVYKVLPGGREVANLDLSNELRLDPEFQAFIPPLSPGEKAALQASILEQGCRDPLVIWAQEGILIDGHNRYSICVAHSIPYQTVEMSFDSRNTVKLWMIGNQLGHRNLTSESVSYLRGTWYELTKQSHGGKRDSSCQNDSLTDKTARELGRTVQSFPRTIYRDAKFTQAVDALSSIGGNEVKWKILNRCAGLTKKEVIALATEVKSHPTKVAKALQGRSLPAKLEDQPPIAHQLTLKVGALVEVYAPDRPDLHHRLGRIDSVGEKTATVWMRHISTCAIQLHTFKHRALNVVPLESEPRLKQVCDRIKATWSFGVVMTKSSSLTQVSHLIAQINGEKPNTVCQRLKEWYQEAPAKKGQQRRELDVSSCFAPLLLWVYSLLPKNVEDIAKALDATSVWHKFTVLSMNILLAGSGIPVA